MQILACEYLNAYEHIFQLASLPWNHLNMAALLMMIARTIQHVRMESASILVHCKTHVQH